MNDEITPARVWITFWRWFGTGIGAVTLVIALISAVTLTAWQEGWWFRTQDTNRETQLTQNGYSNQSSLRTQLTTQIGNAYQITSQIDATSNAGERQALAAQRAAVAGIACSDASQIITPLGSEQAWVTRNCLAGNVRPGSPYYQEGTQ